MLLLSSSQTLWMGLSSADLPGPAASEGTGSPFLPASQPGAHGLMESGLSVCAAQTPCQGCLLQISNFFSRWESADLPC